MKLTRGSHDLLVAALFFGVLWGPHSYGKKIDDTPRELPFPGEIQALESLARSVTALYQSEGQILAMPDGQGFVMVSPFDPKAGSREKVFGSMTETQRLQVVKESQSVPNWRGIDRVEDRVLFFDGGDFAWIEAEKKGMTEILRRSIPWDMIRPPRDSRGEPTGLEIRDQRAEFHKRWLQLGGMKASGVARIPSAWVGAGKKRAYGVALRVKGFPLVTMECDSNDVSSCMVVRQCYLEGASDLAPESVTGIAVSPKRKMILIGDKLSRVIHGFRFDSCYHVPRVLRLRLPEKLKDLGNIHVDQEDRLWISTTAPDDYLNASVYYWSSDGW